MHYLIIFLKFTCYHLLTLHLEHSFKIFDNLPSYWCDGTNKITSLAGDGSGGKIVNA